MTTRRWVSIAVLAGLVQPLLRVPWVPLIGDDWTVMAVNAGALGPDVGLGSTPSDVFAFFDGDPGAMQEAIDAGVTPWFTSLDLKLSFWRPLASATHQLDYTLFGPTSSGPLLHSLLWYLALCAVVAALLQRWLPGRAGGLGGLFFAIAATHQQAASWVCSRNALMTAVFGALALWAHQRWRDAGWRPGAPLSWLALALGLASGEAALGMLGYFVALEMVGTRGPRSERLRAVAPALGVAGLWLLAYAVQGYGATGGAAYVDPLHEPLHFLSVAPLRMAYALGVLFMGVPGELWLLAPAANVPLAAYGAVGTLGIALWVRAVWKDWDAERQRSVRWLALALVLALVPQLGGQLGPRSFVIASIAACAVLGSLAADALDRTDRMRWVGLGALGTVHFVWTLVVYVALTAAYVGIGRVVTDAYVAMGFDVADRTRRPVVLTSPSPVVGVFLPGTYAALHREAMPGWRTVSLAECDHVLTRTGTRSLQLRLVEGAMFGTPYERVVRGDEPPAVGTVHRTEGMDVEVLGVNGAGLPDLIEVRLDVPLEEAELWAWSDGSMVRVTAPAPGSETMLVWTSPL